VGCGAFSLISCWGTVMNPHFITGDNTMQELLVWKTAIWDAQVILIIEFLNMLVDLFDIYD
jgi:hypothetical protein